MRKVIIEVDGKQSILELEDSGKVLDESILIWDENINGPLPDNIEEKLGGISVNKDDLVFDQKKADDQAAAIALEDQEKAELIQSKDDAMKLLKNGKLADNASIKQIVAVVNALVDLHK